MKFRIPVSSELIRTVKDPTLSGTRIIHAYPKAVDLPGDIPLTPDPRKPKESGPIVKKIAESLSSNDGMFHLLNRGITLSVWEATYSSKTQVLTLDLPEDDDFDKYGVIDGGHTYKTLTNVVHDLNGRPGGEATSLGEQHVHLEIMVNVQEHLANVAEARNFSVSLKPWTLAGYRQQFDWFLNSLGDEYTKYIKISENDPQPVGILDLIQVMSAINPGLFLNGDSAEDAYKYAGKCLEYFTDAKDRSGFRKLAGISKDILRLTDYIRLTWKKAYNSKDEAGRRGALGARTEMHLRQRNRTALASYYFFNVGEVTKADGEADYPVEKGFYIPALSSLRPLLVPDNNGQLVWYTDPFKFWDDHGTTIVRTIMTESENVGYNPHTVGRNAAIYRTLYTQVRGILLEQLLKERGGKLPF